MTPAPTWYKAASWIMAALLLVCVVLQYNDPDPIRWMAIYGAGASTSALLPSRRFAVVVLGYIVGAVAMAWAAYLTHEVWGRVELSDLTGKMSEKGGDVEVGREAGGLWIEAVWLFLSSAIRQRLS